MYLDLPWISKLSFYIESDGSCQCIALEIWEHLWIHQDAYLSSGGDREGLLHSRKACCYGLEFRQALDIVLDRISSSSRSASWEWIGDLDNDGFRRLVWILLVVRTHRKDDLLIDIVLLEYADTYLDVGTLHLMTDGLSDVV